MNILGIETSCDETAAAVVKDGRFILSNVVASSLQDHKKYGGVIPEIASRRQLDFMNDVVENALSGARLSLHALDAIAVTMYPGLIGSLLVGISFARALSYALDIPLIKVDHIQAHLYANFLISRKKHNAPSQPADLPDLPAIGLVVSGGHTSLYHIKNFHRFRIIGETLDDAVGEAYDKVARILDLGYPGGPAIDRLAQRQTMASRTQARARAKTGQPRFTCAELPGTLNFSFSGIKTAVFYYKRDHQNDSHFSVPEIVSSFQESIVKVLVKKCVTACIKLKSPTLIVGGGVAANSRLRQRLAEEAVSHRIKVYFPPLSLCTDNAAMIAGLGFHLISQRSELYA
ncbi:MAG TPA: tRNA (adenosine(37)-N6)-threonylcarbamoyltransferase complex transferase subunit TsaD [Candidatus Omnitrophica bacterium]|nr:MAG: tRNA (adenosine(37)-N6)-threonylcarbamoyltransferase complex transferase subunit TsaD [Omnitrophica WOR_2 bacterium GWA2_45_18]OGX18632.1 MAG: tRNA (adenosine(37)-N6)-threonylcarbamoyltransferase complex transferase subunit TsaD [Omnitrophica WOR_2 bacterium GWC2_45_7]HBR15499.1 tRNA (adenosine(37)-N6)-threonylcarbamoyltransferase complex transferase subunit TsaD [Candidatus Omnitrophota bacterium]